VIEERLLFCNLLKMHKNTCKRGTDMDTKDARLYTLQN